MAELVLQVKGIRAQHLQGDGGVPLPVRSDGGSFSIPFGTILVVVGEHGAGKSALVHGIMADPSHLAEEVLFCGFPYTDQDTAVRGRMGIVPESGGFPQELSLQEIGRVAKRIYPNWNTQQFQFLIKEFGMNESHSLKEMPLGMQMEAKIATAMSCGAYLLLIDSVTASVEPVVRNRIYDLLRRYVRDARHSVMLTTHLAKEAQELAGDVLFLREGKVILCGSADTLTSEFMLCSMTQDQVNGLPRERVAGYERAQDKDTVLLHNGGEVLPGIKAKPATLQELYDYYGKGVENQ